MKKYFIYTIILFLLFLGPSAHAGVSYGSGFIPGSIWYSKEPLKEGEIVNIHTAIWNGEKVTVSFKIEFYDKNIILGSRQINIVPSKLEDVSIPWKITSGDHVISAKITESISATGNKEKIILSRNKTSNDKKFISGLVKDKNGVSVPETNPLKSQIDRKSSEIQDILAGKTGDRASEFLYSVDDFRNKKYVQIETIKNKTQSEIYLIKSNPDEVESTLGQNKSIQEVVKKPVAYLRLFIFTILAFIFKSIALFYFVGILLLFYILRFIWRKIRHR